MIFEGQNIKLPIHIEENVLEIFEGDLGNPQKVVTLPALLTEI
jgi:hypothetical protein